MSAFTRVAKLLDDLMAEDRNIPDLAARKNTLGWTMIAVAVGVRLAQEHPAAASALAQDVEASEQDEHLCRALADHLAAAVKRA